ncbi:hypothetical protein VTK73DRAFT_6480 [Phialemonium thermophilum]|uniref:Uncharacterized protein n=1 Tax=Phialemonium thermophilum TaxID=223376 RepID=A0ABR3V0T2_9PEZI
MNEGGSKLPVRGSPSGSERCGRPAPRAPATGQRPRHEEARAACAACAACAASWSPAGRAVAGEHPRIPSTPHRDPGTSFAREEHSPVVKQGKGRRIRGRGTDTYTSPTFAMMTDKSIEG